MRKPQKQAIGFQGRIIGFNQQAVERMRKRGETANPLRETALLEQKAEQAIQKGSIEELLRLKMLVEQNAMELNAIAAKTGGKGYSVKLLQKQLELLERIKIELRRKGIRVEGNEEE